MAKTEEENVRLVRRNTNRTELYNQVALYLLTGQRYTRGRELHDNLNPLPRVQEFPKLRLERHEFLYVKMANS